MRAPSPTVSEKKKPMSAPAWKPIADADAGAVVADARLASSYG